MIARILGSFPGIVFIVSNSEKIAQLADLVIGGEGATVKAFTADH